MSSCCFARGVFGVEPAGPIFERFLALYAELELAIEAGTEEDDHDEDDRESHLAERIVALYPDLLTELREQYQVAEGKLFYSGNGDSRPAECYTPPEMWIFGVGIDDVPGLALTPYFKSCAEWHTWVEMY
jgi:hypothetical protein